MSDVEVFVWGGAGAVGISYVGALQSLEEHGISQKVDHWVGTSAGSIISGFACLGANSEYMKQKMDVLSPELIFDHSDCIEDFKNIWNSISLGIHAVDYWGITSDEKFCSWMKCNFMELGFDPNITFYDLYRHTGKHLVITGTSVGRSQPIYFSKSSSPTWKVLDAIRISKNMPWVWSPLVLQNNQCLSACANPKDFLVDGGLLDVYPLHIADETNDVGKILSAYKRTLGVITMSYGKWIPNVIPEQINNVIQYSMTLSDITTNRMQLLQTQQTPFFWERTCPIQILGIGSRDFYMKPEIKQQLILTGKTSMDRYLDYRNNNKFFLDSSDYAVADDNCTENSKNSCEKLTDSLLFQTNPFKVDLAHFC